MCVSKEWWGREWGWEIPFRPEGLAGSAVCVREIILSPPSHSLLLHLGRPLCFSQYVFFFPLAVLIFEELIIYFNCSIWSYCPYCVSGDSAHPAPNVSTHRQKTERSLQSTFTSAIISCHTKRAMKWSNSHPVLVYWPAVSSLLSFTVRTDPEAHVVHVSTPTSPQLYFFFYV